MIKNIFEVLRHEQHCGVQVLPNGSCIELGCLECGTLMCSVDTSNIGNITSELSPIKDAYSVASIKKYDNLTSKIRQLFLRVIDFSGISKSIAIKLNSEMKFEEDVTCNLYFNRATINEIGRVFGTPDDIPSIEKMYEAVGINMFSHIKEDVCKILKERLGEDYTILKDLEETMIVSNVEYRGNESFIRVISNNRATKSEEDNPTVQEVIVMKDYDELYDYMPNWEDNENESDKYNEFMYRLNNSLIDMSNVDPVKIVELLVSELEGYEYNNHITRLGDYAVSVLKERNETQE